MIQGEIQTFPLIDLAQWLALTRRTGMLVVAQGSDRGYRLAPGSGVAPAPAQVRPGLQLSVEFYFLTGSLVGASSAGRAALTNPEQVREMLANAAHWRTGRFAFSQGPLPAWALSSHLRLPVDAILAEASLPAQDEKNADLLLEISGDESSATSSKTFTLAEHLRLQVVNQLLKEDLMIPAFPALAARVLELTSDENFSLRSLTEVVGKDQAVAAQVLRFANSALQGAGREVYSLEQAVQRLGVDEVVNIVLAASMLAQRLKPRRFLNESRRLWEFSLSSAFAARTIALKVGLKGSLAFMCGLLMDFGATILYSLLLKLMAEQRIPTTIEPELIEEIVWEHHPRIGRVVGEQWKLPQPVTETMANHHCTQENYFNHPYVAIAALADYLVTLAHSIPRAELAESLAHFPVKLVVDQPAAQVLRLTPEIAAATLATLPRELQQAQILVIA
jgi:HD-like signal output (HDOD) protein